LREARKLDAALLQRANDVDKARHLLVLERTCVRANPVLGEFSSDSTVVDAVKKVFRHEKSAEAPGTLDDAFRSIRRLSQRTAQVEDSAALTKRFGKTVSPKPVHIQYDVGQMYRHKKW
jgi:hypothetical protein